MVAITSRVSDGRTLRVVYDRPVDVLHVILGEPVAYEGLGVAGGIELDYSLEDDTPSGAKVLGFKRNGWSKRLDELAAVLGKHLSVDRIELVEAIKRKTG